MRNCPEKTNFPAWAWGWGWLTAHQKIKSVMNAALSQPRVFYELRRTQIENNPRRTCEGAVFHDLDALAQIDDQAAALTIFHGLHIP